MIPRLDHPVITLIRNLLSVDSFPKIHRDGVRRFDQLVKTGQVSIADHRLENVGNRLCIVLVQLFATKCRQSPSVLAAIELRG